MPFVSLCRWRNRGTAKPPSTRLIRRMLGWRSWLGHPRLEGPILEQRTSWICASDHLVADKPNALKALHLDRLKWSCLLGLCSVVQRLVLLRHFSHAHLVILSWFTFTNPSPASSRGSRGNYHRRIAVHATLCAQTKIDSLSQIVRHNKTFFPKPSS